MSGLVAGCGTVIINSEGSVADATGQVLNVASANFPDGSDQPVSLGRQGDQLVSEWLPRLGTATYRGTLFKTSVPAASTLTIPTTLATLASKFCLVNPAGSGKNLVLARFDYFVNSATEVVNVIGITKSTLTTAGLGTLTAGVINNCNINAGLASVAVFYTAATHTDTPVWFMSLIGINATAVGLFQNSYVFDGSIILPPGNCVDVVASAGAQANSLCDMTWLEVPI